MDWHGPGAQHQLAQQRTAPPGRLRSGLTGDAHIPGVGATAFDTRLGTRQKAEPAAPPARDERRAGDGAGADQASGGGDGGASVESAAVRGVRRIGGGRRVRATTGRAAAVGPSRARARRLRGGMTVGRSPHPHMPDRLPQSASQITYAALSRPAALAPSRSHRPPLHSRATLRAALSAAATRRRSQPQSCSATRPGSRSMLGAATAAASAVARLPTGPCRYSRDVRAANPDVVRASSWEATAPASFPDAGSRLLPSLPPAAHRSRMSPLLLFSASRGVPFVRTG